MSDVGLPPGFGVWVLSLGWIILCSAAVLICLLIAWLRTRRSLVRFKHDPFTGWAIGAVVSALAAGLTILFVNASGSLGAFAHWIDRSTVTGSWLVAQAAVWPAMALSWNRVLRRNRN